MSKKIYFVCSDTRRPSGGVKQLFRMVDHLNELGFNAVLVRKSPLKSIKWFSYNTPIEYYPYLYFLIKNKAIKKSNQFKLSFKLKQLFNFNKKLPDTDSIIVYPEIYGDCIHTILPNNKYVIFNQNCFLTYNLFDLNDNISPYKNSRFIGGITVSDNSYDYLSFAYPSQKFHRLRIGISETFTLGHTKKNILAYMPRKLGADANQILNILRERNALNGWEVIAIDNVSEEKVADILKETTLFLSFNHNEGLGLPPLEAMACGCYVIGYAGFGGEEYFKQEFCSKIQDGDIIAYVKEIEKAISLHASDAQILINKGKLASAFVKRNFSIEHEMTDTKMIWNNLLENIEN